jgi:hypothetical protein
MFIWRIAHRWSSTFVVPPLLGVLLRIHRPRWRGRRRAQAVGPPPVFRPKRKRFHLRSFRGYLSRMSFFTEVTLFDAEQQSTPQLSSRLFVSVLSA